MTGSSLSDKDNQAAVAKVRQVAFRCFLGHSELPLDMYAAYLGTVEQFIEYPFLTPIEHMVRRVRRE